jgi:hypothetical protein
MFALWEGVQIAQLFLFFASGMKTLSIVFIAPAFYHMGDQPQCTIVTSFSSIVFA